MGAGIAGAIARAGYWPLGIRAGVVRRQVAAAFPGTAPSRVAEIARESYENLGRVAVESTLLSRQGRSAVLERFGDSPEWDVVARAHAKGKGVVLMAGHLGNWELSGAFVAAKGVPVFPIMRGMSNPLSERFIRRTRERLGMQVMHDQESVRKVPRALRDGHAVGFLSDQATVGLASTFVPFFGRPAKTPRGAAVFALRLGAPIVMIHALRGRDGRYTLRAQELALPDTGDRERDVDTLIASFSAALEALVRQYPGQYFWQHRRWKHQPADTPAHLREP
jgi:KDO2-lipid IV(A) lauroyltransferase